MKKVDLVIDKMYENRVQLLKYFAVALVCALFRTLLDSSLQIIGVAASGAELTAYSLWALVMFWPLKKFVFKYRANDIFALLNRFFVYLMCVALLWLAKQILVSLLYILTNNITVALALGGMFCELICLVLMFKVAFKVKKDK